MTANKNTKETKWASGKSVGYVNTKICMYSKIMCCKKICIFKIDINFFYIFKLFAKYFWMQDQNK